MPQLQMSVRRPYKILETIVFFSRDHFGRSITWRTTRGITIPSHIIKISKPKIHDFDIVVIIEKKVFRFQIPVYDADLMNVLDARDYLLEVLTGLLLHDSLLLHDVLKELSARGQLHYKIQHVVIFYDLLLLLIPRTAARCSGAAPFSG